MAPADVIQPKARNACPAGSIQPRALLASTEKPTH
jgi:hypothetical protein